MKNNSPYFVKSSKNNPNELEKCVHTGKETNHLTDYKPNCKDCKGYMIRCEQEGKYKPHKEMIRR